MNQRKRIKKIFSEEEDAWYEIVDFEDEPIDFRYVTSSSSAYSDTASEFEGRLDSLQDSTIKRLQKAVERTEVKVKDIDKKMDRSLEYHQRAEELLEIRRSVELLFGAGLLIGIFTLVYFSLIAFNESFIVASMGIVLTAGVGLWQMLKNISKIQSN